MAPETALARFAALIDLGGPVVALLLALSFVATTTAIYKVGGFLLTGIGRGSPTRWREALLQRLRRKPAEARAAHAEAALGRLEGGLRLLDSIAQVAPLLGLFGTVLGMIDAFRALEAAGADIDPAALAGGIWVALTTTAVGLAVAMPTALVLSWLDARLTRERLFVAEALSPVEARGG